MRTEEILAKVDALVGENRGAEAEQLLDKSIREAMEEQDDEALLIFLNEMTGYKRETSQVEDSYRFADAALKLAERMGIGDGIAGATTRLNAANAYRAGGKLEESLKLYRQVNDIYEKQLGEDDMLFASLYNNISLLYQEMGDFAAARDSLLRALPIAKKNPDAWFEVAVTHANLAATRLELGENGQAWEDAGTAAAIFEEHGLEDSHYAAALASKAKCLYGKKEYGEAAAHYEKAMRIMKASLGENEYYHRLEESLAACRAALEGAGGPAVCRETSEGAGGLAICRAYYEAYGKPMIRERFADYEDRIAVGLCGEGSDCLGFDDAFSRDHDWGPGFAMWVSDEVYEKIGPQLEEAYKALPKEYEGYTRRETARGRGRTGVCTVEGFYKRILGEENVLRISDRMTADDVRFSGIPDEALCAAVSGEVFCDKEGTFSAVREFLQKGWPESLRYLKIAESMAKFSQGAQYNLARSVRRNDPVAAGLSLAEGLRHAMKLLYYAAGQYPPHDKWLYRGLAKLDGAEREARLIDALMRGGASCRDASERVEELAALMSDRYYALDIISDREPYLEYHVAELLKKASLADRTDEELVDGIARAEFEAFDKVQNAGGRASCQNNWKTFNIMRKSQYMTWSRPMLIQYFYEFEREYARGRNLIEEKYGRMMESTAPEEYERIKDNFPAIPPEKAQIIEAIVQIQVGFMEEFAREYPTLAGNARTIHTYDDRLDDTSYETYLRGEISTYSDKMLTLYGRFVAQIAGEGKNLAKMTMENSVHLYGYRTLEDAENAG